MEAPPPGPPVDPGRVPGPALREAGARVVRGPLEHSPPPDSRWCVMGWVRRPRRTQGKDTHPPAQAPPPSTSIHDHTHTTHHSHTAGPLGPVPASAALNLDRRLHDSTAGVGCGGDPVTISQSNRQILTLSCCEGKAVRKKNDIFSFSHLLITIYCPNQTLLLRVRA